MWSIIGFDTFSFSLNALDFVLGAGSSAQCIVVFSLLSAISFIPGVGGNGVPKSIGLGLGGRIDFDDVASSEVGFEDGLGESKEAEVSCGVVSLKVEALVVAVVPGSVSEFSLGLDDGFLGSVPVVVAGSQETSGGEGEESQEDNQNFTHLNLWYVYNSNIRELHFNVSAN